MKTQAKPIFIVELPNKMLIDSDHHNDIQKHLSETLHDYHVLVSYTQTNEIKYQCFYEKDFNEVKYEELKRIVEEQINYEKKT